MDCTYYPCSENKGADQLRGYREADLRLCFRICKKPVSHDEAKMVLRNSIPVQSDRHLYRRCGFRLRFHYSDWSFDLNTAVASYTGERMCTDNRLRSNLPRKKCG